MFKGLQFRVWYHTRFLPAASKTASKTVPTKTIPLKPYTFLKLLITVKKSEQQQQQLRWVRI